MTTYYANIYDTTSPGSGNVKLAGYFYLDEQKARETVRSADPDRLPIHIAIPIEIPS